MLRFYDVDLSIFADVLKEWFSFGGEAINRYEINKFGGGFFTTVWIGWLFSIFEFAAINFFLNVPN